MKRILSLILVIALAVTTVFAQGGAESADEGVELTLMHYATKDLAKRDPYAKAVNDLLDEYLAAHPEVKVSVSELAHDDYQVKFQAMAAVGELPSIYMLKGPWVDTLAENDLLYDFSEDLKNQEYAENYADGIFALAQRGDKIYGIPYAANVHSCFVYYDKAMWKAAGYDEFPKTWDEVFEANEYFKSQGIPMIGIGNLDKWPMNSCVLSTLTDRFAGSEWTQHILAKDGQASFLDEDFVKALTLIDDLAKAGAFNKDGNMLKNNQIQAMFAQGLYGCTIQGNWAVANIPANADAERLANIGIAALPMPEGGKGDPNAASGGCGWYYGISNDLSDAEKKAASDLLFYILGQEYSNRIVRDGKEPAPCRVENADFSGVDQFKKDYLDLTTSYKTVPIFDQWMSPLVIDAMNTGMQEMINGMKTPQQVAEMVQAAYVK